MGFHDTAGIRLVKRFTARHHNLTSVIPRSVTMDHRQRQHKWRRARQARNSKESLSDKF
jgi:hypothetical protein